MGPSVYTENHIAHLLIFSMNSRELLEIALNDCSHKIGPTLRDTVKSVEEEVTTNVVVTAVDRVVQNISNRKQLDHWNEVHSSS